MGRKHALSILMVAAGAVVLFVSVEPRQGRATSTPQPDPAVHLGTLQGREYDVRIEMTEAGTRYTVVDARGVVIASRLPLESLAEQYPLLAPHELWANERGQPLGPLMVVPDDGPN
jgi:hypothetical protein